MTNQTPQIFNAPFSRRTFCRGAALFAAGLATPPIFAAEPEKTEVTIAVGGKNLYYYLPAAIAEWKGFYKEEGLDVKVVDFQGGSKSLQAVVGGSADVVSGAFEHTLSMQAKRQAMRAFVLQGRAPQCVFAVNRKTMPNFQDVKELKGRRIGVTAPGSSSHVIANYVLKRAGIASNEVAVIGIGSGAGAIAAVRAGQVDAFVGLDPVITQLMQDDAIQIVTDTRNVATGESSTKGYARRRSQNCSYSHLIPPARAYDAKQSEPNSAPIFIGSFPSIAVALRSTRYHAGVHFTSM